MWTGPAPMRQYDNIPHVRWWRTFMEYGNGITGDMCVHMFDTARWMLDLGWPTRISSSGGIFVQKDGKSNISDSQSATFTYPNFDVVWQHRTWGNSPDPDYPWAVFIHGDKGTLKANTDRFEFFPQGKRQATISGRALIEPNKYPEEKNEPDFEPQAAAATRSHMLDFLAARQNRSKPVADIEQGHISAASSILANVSMELGRSLTIDPKTGQLVGDPEAAKLLARPYRGDWKHPADVVGEWTPWAKKDKA
jgi:predicted dehydrogenase